MLKFRLGEFGRWISKGDEKCMECVGVIPAEVDPKRSFSELMKEGFSTTTRVKDLSPRTHESYIFAGPVGPRGGKRKLYWPRVSSLEKAKRL